MPLLANIIFIVLRNLMKALELKQVKKVSSMAWKCCQIQLSITKWSLLNLGFVFEYFFTIGLFRRFSSTAFMNIFLMHLNYLTSSDKFLKSFHIPFFVTASAISLRHQHHKRTFLSGRPILDLCYCYKPARVLL